MCIFIPTLLPKGKYYLNFYATIDTPFKYPTCSYRDWSISFPQGLHAHLSHAPAPPHQIRTPLSARLLHAAAAMTGRKNAKEGRAVAILIHVLL